MTDKLNKWERNTEERRGGEKCIKGRKEGKIEG
jgi:hypothetical protein